jgi:hypothetical protein
MIHTIHHTSPGTVSSGMHILDDPLECNGGSRPQLVGTVTLMWNPPNYKTVWVPDCTKPVQ